MHDMIFYYILCMLIVNAFYNYDCITDATRRMKLPGSVYTGLQYANIPCLVEALHALKPQRFFNSEEYKYYTECNGMMPNQARHKCNEFSFKLQQLVTSPTAEIAASLFLSLRNSYEQSCDTNVDSHYQLACVIREGGMYLLHFH